MKSKLPKMRLRRAWRHYPAGAVIQPPGTLRQVLEQQGVAEVIADPVEVKETSEAEDKPKRRRGRPRKTEVVDG